MSSQYVKLGNRSLDQWKVTELKEELKRRKLSTKGLKEDLVKRLDEDVRIERENSTEDVENDEIDANQSDVPFEQEAQTESDVPGGAKEFMDVGISMDEKADAKPEHETDDHRSLFEGKVEVSLEQETKTAELEDHHEAEVAAVETTVVINETVEAVTAVSGQHLDNDGTNEDGDSTAVSNNDGLPHVQEDAKLELSDPKTQLPLVNESSTPMVPSGGSNLEDSGSQDEAVQMETDDPKHLQPDSNVQPSKYQNKMLSMRWRSRCPAVLSPMAVNRIHIPWVLKSHLIKQILKSHMTKKKLKSHLTKKMFLKSHVTKKILKCPLTKKMFLKSPLAKKMFLKSPLPKKMFLKSPLPKKVFLKSPLPKKVFLKSPLPKNMFLKSPLPKKMFLKSPLAKRYLLKPVVETMQKWLIVSRTLIGRIWFLRS